MQRALIALQGSGFNLLYFTLFSADLTLGLSHSRSTSGLVCVLECFSSILASLVGGPICSKRRVRERERVQCVLLCHFR